MNRKEILNKRNKLKDEIDDFKKLRESTKDCTEINKKIEEKKKLYTFYNTLLKKL